MLVRPQLQQPRPPVGEIDWALTINSIIALFVVSVVAAVLILVIRWKAREDRKSQEAYQAFVAEKAKARWEDLCRRFGQEAAARILRRDVWQGQTTAMLFESLGHPVDFDEKVLKTKVKRIYKWGQTGRNRYATRVTVEDGLVVGWEM